MEQFNQGCERLLHKNYKTLIKEIEDTLKMERPLAFTKESVLLDCPYYPQ